MEGINVFRRRQSRADMKTLRWEGGGGMGETSFGDNGTLEPCRFEQGRVTQEVVCLK